MILKLINLIVKSFYEERLLNIFHLRTLQFELGKVNVITQSLENLFILKLMFFTAYTLALCPMKNKFSKTYSQYEITTKMLSI